MYEVYVLWIASLRMISMFKIVLLISRSFDWLYFDVVQNQNLSNVKWHAIIVYVTRNWAVNDVDERGSKRYTYILGPYILNSICFCYFEFFSWLFVKRTLFLCGYRSSSLQLIQYH